MTLSVTNTLTDEQETFNPYHDDEVLLYVCGLTVSDDAHLGHARLWVQADVIHRWLEYLGYHVTHVENFTDVNEKIVAQIDPDKEASDEASVAETYTSSVIQDMRGLNLRRASVYPRVSGHIPEIIDLVETLVENGYAYESDGSVYFDVLAFDEYGKLSNHDVASATTETDSAIVDEKRNPADFALWKSGAVNPSDVASHRDDSREPLSSPTGQTWDSPWGEGRPGWHIECSAMAMTHLNQTIDIHLGGRDLVFPHHENEIAQSEAATGQPFARHWMHVGLLQMKGDKMSSSIGNILTVEEALRRYGVNVIRTFYLSSAYGSEQTLDEAALTEAAERWETISRAYDRAVEACDSTAARTKTTDNQFQAGLKDVAETFTRAMNDDFNVRKAMASLLELASAVNAHLEDYDKYDYQSLYRAIALFDEFGGDVFGLSLGENTATDATDTLSEDLIDLVVDIREEERSAGNYERSDALRERLADLGVEIEDSDTGPTYRITNHRKQE
jgi:cysteinyl-tRNA synthetase